MKLSLRTTTPLHIGGSNVLTPMDFVQHATFLYVIGEGKLAAVLGQHHLIDDFVTEMAQSGRNFNLTRYLQKKGLLTPEIIEAVSLYKSRLLSNEPREVRTFIRDAFARPFVPGSSIKGALRTGVLYKVLKSLPQGERDRRLLQPVKQNLLQIREDKDKCASIGSRFSTERYKKNFTKDLEKDLMQGYDLPGNPGQADPKYDLFRCLKVRDCAPLSANALAIYPVRIYSARRQDIKKDTVILAECFPAGQSFTCEILFDENLWHDFSASNKTTHWGVPLSQFDAWLREPWSCLREMCQDVISHERTFFEKEFGIEDSFLQNADLRLGWGGGLLSASISLLLPPDLRREMRNLLFVPRDDAPAPKSRKVIERNDEPFYSMGWLKIDQPK